MTVKKTFKIQDLDCANCAAKLERAIAKTDGVVSANVAFMTGRLTIEAEDTNFDEIMKKVIKTCKKTEPDCTIII